MRGLGRRAFILGATGTTALAVMPYKARAAASFNFAANFGAVATGTKVGPAELQKIWVNPAITSIYDADTAKQFFTVASGGTYGSHCFRYFYPQGSYGMRSEFYHVQLGRPGVPVNVEYDWMFENDFDLLNRGGKIGPSIQWGPIDGPAAGTKLVCWWEICLRDNGYNTPPRYQFQTQDQRTGTEWGGASKSPNQIVLGQWHRIRLQMMGGPQGWTKGWVDGVLVHSRGPTPNNFATDSVFVDFASFFGGGSSACAARWDCHARHANVHIWTG
jgi:hypothetical protein